MKIKVIYSQHRNDFYYDAECEHCTHVELKKAGYDDDYFHKLVIPGMYCGGCGKNRAGDVVRATPVADDQQQGEE